MPLIFFVLVGLAAIGLAVIAALAAMAALAINLALLGITAFVIMLVGFVGDYFYNKKMARKEVPYRLPFYLRWKGWRTTPAPEHGLYKRGTFYDRRVGAIILIVR